jgi:hypothetical protein
MNRIDYSTWTIPAADFAGFVQHELPDRLSDAWCADYRRAFRDADIVSIPLDPFVYLFDLTGERALGAYGIMGGKVSAPRDRARMAGHPKAEGRDYHRGHLMPHSGGGGTDINLFSQLGSLNVGAFRELEKIAVASPGTFYFVRLLYDLTGSQRPASVEQGLLINAKSSRIETRFFLN